MEAWTKPIISGTAVRNLYRADGDVRVAGSRRCLILWVWWVLAAIVGGTLSLVLWEILASFIGGRFFWRTLADIGGGTLSLFVGFLPLFAAQRLVLRRHIPRIDSWVLGSLVGICIGTYVQRVVIFILGIATASASGTGPQTLGIFFGTQLFWERTLGLFVLWGVIGVAQWMAVRRRIRHAGWWVLASALGGAVSGAVELVLGSASGDLLLSHLARWGIYGALTGIVLVLLLQNRIKRRLLQRIERSRRVSTYPDAVWR